MPLSFLTAILPVPHVQAPASLSSFAKGRSAAVTPAAAAPSRQRQPLQVWANTQRSNSTTKKRTSGPPGLPPINANDGGGGGGGWDGHRIARNVAINAALFGIYCLLDSGGPGGIFGGGGGGGGKWAAPPRQPSW